MGDPAVASSDPETSATYRSISRRSGWPGLPGWPARSGTAALFWAAVRGAEGRRWRPRAIDDQRPVGASARPEPRGRL